MLLLLSLFVVCHIIYTSCYIAKIFACEYECGVSFNLPPYSMISTMFCHHIILWMEWTKSKKERKPSCATLFLPHKEFLKNTESKKIHRETHTERRCEWKRERAIWNVTRYCRKVIEQSNVKWQKSGRRIKVFPHPIKENQRFTKREHFLYISLCSGSLSHSLPHLYVQSLILLSFSWTWRIAYCTLTLIRYKQFGWLFFLQIFLYLVIFAPSSLFFSCCFTSVLFFACVLCV